MALFASASITVDAKGWNQHPDSPSVSARVPSDNNVILGHGDDSVERNRIGLSLVFDVKPMCDRIVLLSSTRRSTTPISWT